MNATTNQAQFSSTIADFAKQLGIKAGKLQKKITFDLHKDIMERTPVLTGRARASWFASVGEPSTEVPPEANKGEVIPMPIPPELEIDGTRDSYIISNISYIQFLDEGSSGKAPAGMTKLAMAAQDQRLEEAVRDL